ncbi:Flp pilus assembly protein CpaB [Massilia sp. PAMC28688]|uniref:Flp pilus assembly protein CpaB n=1 Tax=Massilia sp. PAMC28688 TaxID=2861283 RepID=UPI001C627712|nr:Flp pilus assembly protein CpaB [Massilia sp. PAMC28688]QYF95033.1 Flp pilus assembly protein CpaB [Massilia sp. PAMC28688]
MKNKRAIVMLAVAVLFGIAAVALAWKWLQGQASANSNRVVVATTDVHRGQRLAPEMLRLVERPSKDVPKDAFTDPALLNERVLKANIVKGEILAETKLAPAGTMGGLSALISEGKRAITVRVNDVIGVAGFALPGNYVDIIVHTERDPVEGERAQRGALHVSKIVLERILVLAVAQEVNRDETKPKVVNAVTLEVTPEQAENLDLARGVGTLSLALRNQIDRTLPATAGATKSTLLDDLDAIAARAKPVAAPAPVKRVAARPRPAAPRLAVNTASRRDCVSVLNGLQTSQECF